MKRQVSVRKVIDRDELEEIDEAIAYLMAVPVAKERRLLSAVDATGGDHSAVRTAVLAARSLGALREAYGGELPIEVRKAAADVAGALWDEHGDYRGGGSQDEDDDDENEENDMDDTLDEQQRTSRQAAQRNEATLAKAIAEDMDGISAAYDQVALDWAADRVQKADPTLTRPEAVVKALDADPGLADRARRAQATAIEKAESDRVRQRERAEQQLQAKADRIRKTAGDLTEAQAFVRALDENPKLARALA